MNAVATKLLADCAAQGIRLRLGERGKLKVSPPPEKLPADLVEQLKQHKQEILTLLSQQQSPPFSYKDRYHQTAESLREDCLALDANWLADRHPELWQRMALIDLQLTKLEQKGAESGEYETMLTRLVQTVKKARALYEQECQQKAAAQ